MAKKFKIERTETAHKLIDLIEDVLSKIDEEMRIGNYEVSDAPPFDWDEEEDGDYYKAHEKAVDDAVKARIKLDEFILKYKQAL